MNISLDWLWLNGFMAYTISMGFSNSQATGWSLLALRKPQQKERYQIYDLRIVYELQEWQNNSHRQPTTFGTSSITDSRRRLCPRRSMLFFYFIGYELLCEPDQWSISLIRQLNNSIRIDIDIFFSLFSPTTRHSMHVWCV